MTAAAKSSRATDVTGFVDRIVRPLTRVLNPLVLRVAGARWLPMFSLLHHRGHKSGRLYATPISAMPRGGFFWLGLTFGQDAGWVRNILAAGDCAIRYRAVDYHLTEPIMLDAAPVKSQLPPVMRVGLRVIGVHKVIRMKAIPRREATRSAPRG